MEDLDLVILVSVIIVFITTASISYLLSKSESDSCRIDKLEDDNNELKAEIRTIVKRLH